jgi:hypothetical protein
MESCQLCAARVTPRSVIKDVLPRLEQQFKDAVESLAKLQGSRLPRLDVVSICCLEANLLPSFLRTMADWKPR